MTIDRSVAMKLWKDIFGDAMWAQDCFGTWMYRDDYGVFDKARTNRPGGTGKAYVYGWEIDHIMPISKFKDSANANYFNNLEPLHFINNRKKADNTSFEINGISYSVVKCDICSKHGTEGYGIVNNSKNKRVDWKYTKNLYYV